ELLASLADPAALARRRTRMSLRAALAPVFAPGLTTADRRDRLRQFKQAQELTIVWRYLLGATAIEGYSREMTHLAEATLQAGWSARRHHAGRRRIRGGPAPAPRQQGQRLRGVGRRARTVL